VIVAAIAVTYYAFNRGLPFSRPFTLHAIVSNSVNVRGGDPVRIAGIDVGRVVAVTPHGTDSSLEFTLSGAALPVHRDATIRIRDRLFLEGSYYIELDSGTPSSPVLKDGATIPAAQTSGPVQFYHLLSVFDRPTRGNLVGLLNSLEEGFGQPSGTAQASSGAAGLKAAAPQFRPLLADTAVISRAFRGTGPGDLGRLLRSGAAVTATLAERSAQLADLVDGLNRTASALASSDGALAQTVAGLDQTLRATPPALRQIDLALPSVATLSRALDPSLRVAPPLLDALTTTAQQLAAVLAPGQRGPLIASLRATFQELPSILTRLATSFPIGKQVTDCLQTHVLPILHSTVPDGSLSTGQSVLLDFMHFLPGVAGASGNFDGNGPYTRFVAGGGTNTLSGTFAGQQLVATGPPGGGALEGARPQWIGDLTPSAFRPDEPCANQQLPSLASPTAAPDLTPAGARGAKR
jgi:virulence factor Mce-like protein